MTDTSTEIAWQASGTYTDIRYETTSDGIAKITICRPEVHNAFRPQTLIEISDALTVAREDESVGVIILTGEGGKAFCSGGDQRVRGDTGYQTDPQLHRPVPRHRPARADAPLPQADRGHGGRLGHRRRARAARGVRPDDRRGQRDVRPGRPPGRLVRRRLRGQLAGPAGGHEEGQGDLVPVPPLRRPGGAGHGPGQPGRPAGRPGDARRWPGAARCSRSPRSRCA